MTLTQQPVEGLRIAFPASLDSAREAVVAATKWLGKQSLTEDECLAWELVLSEVTTNAVIHSKSDAMLRLEASSTSKTTEISLTDHSSGFDWPEHVKLPEDESEHGRGLFIILSLTDHSNYLRSVGENMLRLVRERRTVIAATEDPPTTLDLMAGEVTACYDTLANIFRLSTEAVRNGSTDMIAAKWLQELRQISGADFLTLRLVSPEGSELATIASAPAESLLSACIDLSNTHFVECRAFVSRQDQWFDDDTDFHPADPLYCRGTAVSGFAHPIETGGQVIGVLTLASSRVRWEPNFRDIHVARSLGDCLGTVLHILRSRDQSSPSRLINSELPIAADVQCPMRPAEPPQRATLH